MKNINGQRKHWLDKKARTGAHLKKRRKLRRIRARQLKRLSVRVGATSRLITVYSKGKIDYALLEGEKRPVPSSLTLRPEDWNETVNFVNSVKDALSLQLERGKFQTAPTFHKSITRVRGYWDFTTIRSITIQAALLLASQYDRASYFRSWVPRAIEINRWDPHVRATLDRIGFFELAGVNSSETEITQFVDGTLLRMKRESTTDGEVISKYFNQLGLDLQTEDPRLNDAIMEAITNSVQHAWKNIDLCPPFTVESWWIAAQLSEENDNRRLRVVVYDHGASIPVTLPSWEQYPAYQRFFRRWLKSKDTAPPIGDHRYDGAAIDIAIRVGRSSTGKGHRGKGLGQILEAINLCKSGRVTIYSRCGVYSRTSGGRPEIRNHDVPIVGTMIVWSLLI